MRNYKTFDLFSQLLLLPVVILSFFFDDSGVITAISLIAFAVLQIISLFIHISIGKQHWKKSWLRKIHLGCTGILILIMLFGLFKPAEDKYDMSGLGVIAYALVPAVLVALFYTIITFLEWKKLTTPS